MKVAEIAEEDLLRLQKLNTFANNIMAHSKAALLLEEAAKMVDPSIKTPRLERAAAENEPIKALSKQITDLQTKLDTEAADRARNETLNSLTKVRNEGFAELRSRHKYTDEGIAHVEKIMTEKGILDPLDAAAIFERNNPPATVSKPHTGSSWNFASPQAGDAAADKAINALMASRGEDEGALDQLTMLALSEVRQGYQR